MVSLKVEEADLFSLTVYLNGNLGSYLPDINLNKKLHKMFIMCLNWVQNYLEA